MLICSSCGATLRDGTRFCTSCGAPITDSEATAAPPEPAVPQQPPLPQEPAYPQEPSYPQQQPYSQEQSYRPDFARRPTYQQPPYQPDGYQRNPPRQRQMVQQRPEPRYRAQAPVYGGITISGIFNRAMGILSTKPLLLWGLSLMYTLLSRLAAIFCVLPIISLPVTFALMVGMKAIYLDGIHGKEVTSDQLFAGFKNFFRSAGGIAWMALWILIWSLVPIAGFVLAIIKSYSYRFVPYIMVEDPEISATAALRRSKELTNGMKGKMFLADLLIVGILFGLYLVLILLSLIPFIGALFILVTFLLTVLVVALLPLFSGLVEAAFYDECPRK